MAKGTAGKVTLFYPTPYDKRIPNQWAPLALLALAGPLDELGYEVIIIDEKMEPECEKKVIKLVKDSLCFGISSMTGIQLGFGLKMAKLVREKYPEIPIVWGGWHATLEPKSTIESPYADIIVKGQGEESFPQVLERLKNKESLEGILGVIYKEDSKIVVNPDRPLKDPNNFAPLAYHLIDVERYKNTRPIGFAQLTADMVDVELKGWKVQGINYISSHGCPFDCGFCCVKMMFQRRWFGLAPERVLNEIENLVKNYGVNTIFFEDNDFIINARRTRTICQGILDRGLNIKWMGSGRVDLIANFNDEMMRLLKESGCFQIFIGAESGCQKVLDLINKKTKVEDNVKAVKRLKDYGINPHVSYIVGFPTEPKDSFWDTLRQIGEIKMIGEEVRTHIGFFTPYPGAPLYPLALKYGLKEPKTLEEWSKFHFVHLHLKSFTKKELKIFKRLFRFYLRFAYPDSTIKERMRRGRMWLIFALFHKLAQIRFRKKWTHFMVEYWFWKMNRKLRHLPTLPGD